MAAIPPGPWTVVSPDRRWAKIGITRWRFVLYYLSLGWTLCEDLEAEGLREVTQPHSGPLVGFRDAPGQHR